MGRLRGLRGRENLRIDKPLASLEAKLDRVGETRHELGIGLLVPLSFLNHLQSINNNIDGMVLLLVEFRDLLDRIDSAVHADPRESSPFDVGNRLLVPSLASLDNGRIEDELRPFRQFQQRLDDLLGTLPAHRLPAFGAVREADGPVEQTQIVVNLRDRGDDGTRISTRRTLLDGDCGGQSLDPFHIWLLHLIEELTGIGRKRLHITSLPFGIKCIKGQRGLPATRESRHNGQRITGNPHVHIPQVVDLRPLNDDVCHGSG